MSGRVMYTLLGLFTACSLMNAAEPLDDPRDNGSPYGVLAFLNWNHDWNRYHFKSQDDIDRAARLTQEAGIGFVRMDILWADVEPDPGRFDFARYDAIVDALRKNGISVLGLLDYNPAWRGGTWNDAPDPDAYLAYARATVRHFKDRIRYWEIWNEPDHANYWQPQDDLAAYSRLLRAATAAIRTEDPSAVMVMGGLAQDYAPNLRRIYQQAGKDAFDVVNIHPFANPLRPEAMKQVAEITTAIRRVMIEFKDEQKPIWFTEIGCPGVPADGDPAPWWLGTNPTEAQQAAWVTQVIPGSLRLPGVQKVFWAFLRDTDHHFLNAIDHFGLLRDDFSAKPAYASYKNLTSKK